MLAAMRSGPRKQTSEEALYAMALRALMRRSYSVFEMRTYLERRAEPASLAKGVVARLREKGLIDDARYALEFTRRHAQIRKQGRYRIERELRARGVADRHIATAIEEGLADTDESVVVRKVIERRLRARQGPVERRHLASLQRTLLRAGFDGAVIRRELNRAAKGEAEELPEDLGEAEG